MVTPAKSQDSHADRLLDLALDRLEQVVTESVRAALEEVARTAGHLLVGPAGDDWGRRYGRSVACAA